MTASRGRILVEILRILSTTCCVFSFTSSLYFYDEKTTCITSGDPSGQQLLLLLQEPSGVSLCIFLTSMASFGSPVMASGLASLQVRTARTTEKTARYESHLSFLTACTDLSVIPKGMRLHFGTHALPKSDYLLQAVKDATNTASLQIVATCRDTYRVLISKERTAL